MADGARDPRILYSRIECWDDCLGVPREGTATAGLTWESVPDDAHDIAAFTRHDQDNMLSTAYQFGHGFDCHYYKTSLGTRQEYPT